MADVKSVIDVEKHTSMIFLISLRILKRYIYLPLL